MEKNKLGNTKYSLSKIGLGTVQFGLDYGFTKKKTQEEVDRILSYANQRGINLIDTARSYGDSEEKIGNYISQNSNNFIVATKLGIITYEDALTQEALKSTILKSIETSLKKLRKDKLDIVQLHQTDQYLINNPYFWELLIEIKEEKIIGSIGASVYQENETEYLIQKYRHRIDFFQIPYNVFDRRFESLIELFKKENIGLITRSAFLKGVIPCKTEDLPEELKELIPYKKKLEQIAKNYSLSVSQIALLYVCNKDFITSTILGVDSANELKQNVNTIENNNFEKSLKIDELKVNNERLINPGMWKNI